MLRSGCLRGLTVALVVISLSFEGEAGMARAFMSSFLGDPRATNVQAGVGGAQVQAGVMPSSMQPGMGQMFGQISPMVGPGGNAGSQMSAAVMPFNLQPIQGLPGQISSMIGQMAQPPMLMMGQGPRGQGPMGQGPMGQGPRGQGPMGPFRGRGDGRRGPGRWSDGQMGGGMPPPDQQCTNSWQNALLSATLNYNNWQCSARFNATTNALQNCVQTGVYPAPATPSTFQFNSSYCKWTLPLFCDDTVNDIVNSMLGSGMPAGIILPPLGYTELPGMGFYKVHNETLTWAAAQAACAAEGANLAVPTRPGDYVELMKLLNATIPGNNGAFIGYTDVVQEGNFVAVTGQPSCQLGNIVYNMGEPNNGGGNENCLQIGYQQTSAANDISCTALLPFICEITAPSRTMCRF